MDTKQLTTFLNVLRERYGAKELIQEDLRKALPKELQSRIYNLELLGIVNVRKDGVRKMYSFPNQPIHISKVEELMKRPVKVKKLNEKECIAFLKSKGYKILMQKYIEI